jgi:hypothetical protein
MPRQRDEGDDPIVKIPHRRRPELVQGVFRSEAIATAVAKELKAAYPDRVVMVIDEGDQEVEFVEQRRGRRSRVLVRLIA